MRYWIAGVGFCIAFWAFVIFTIVSNVPTTPLLTTDQKICAYLAEHSLGATWRYTVDKLDMSSDMGVAAIEEARRSTCPELKLKG